LHKIDLKNSIMPENENSDEICCSSGTWIVSIKELFIFWIIE
jgi:hypothetical protein